MTDPPDISILDELAGDLPVDRLLETCSTPLARYAVYYLADASTVSLDHLSDVLTGWVNADTGQIATRADRDRIRVVLYHVYLPALDSLDVLQFDRENRTVGMNGVSPPLESFIEWMRRFDRSDEGLDFA